MRKYIVVKGRKIAFRKYKAFVVKLRKRQKQIGHQISPKLFSILLDKLLRKRVRRTGVKAKTTPNPTTGSISSSNIAPSDNAIKASADAIDRKHAATNDVPKLKEPEKKLLTSGKTITLTENEYDKFRSDFNRFIGEANVKKEKAEEKYGSLREKEKIKKLSELHKNLAEEKQKLNESAISFAKDHSKVDKIRDKAKKLGIDARSNRKLIDIENDIKAKEPNYSTRNDLASEYEAKHNQNLNKILDEIDIVENNFDDISGAGTMSDAGLSDLQIDKLMRKYPSYLGTISHDEISTLLPKIKPRSVGGFVINTDPASMGGAHWQAVYFDAKKDMEIDFYDSFGDRPDKTIMKGIKLIADKLDCDTYLKIKINRVKAQDDRSSNCGFFAAKFLIDRFNHKHFTHASGWDDALENASRKGEAEIKKFKSHVGYGAFSYVKSFVKKAVDVGKEAVKRVAVAITGRTHAPPAVRSLLEKYGNQTITSIRVGREPVNRVITSILNEISEGAVERNRQKLGYDNIYHLFLIIHLSGGHSFKIERNESVHVSGPSLSSGSQVVNVSLNGKKISLNDFIEKASKGSSFWQYNPVSNNCQDFVITSLRSNGLLTGDVSGFVKQDAEKLLLNTGLAQKIAEGVTDLGSRLHVLIYGVGRKKKRTVKNVKQIVPIVAPAPVNNIPEYRSVNSMNAVADQNRRYNEIVN